MRLSKLGVLKAAVSMTVATILGGCALQEPPPFDPRRIEQMQQDATVNPPAMRQEALPTTLPTVTVERAGGVIEVKRPETRPVTKPVRLTLQETAHRAVANSLGVRVAGYDSAIDAARVLEAQARFDPLFFAQGQFQRSFPQGIGGGDFDPITLYSQSLEAGFRQLLTTGGQIELKYQVQRQEPSSQFGSSSLVPTVWPSFYQNDLILQLTHPLLRDFGRETNLARITIARNDQRISQLDFQKSVEDLLFQARDPDGRGDDGVEPIYWELYTAQQELEIQDWLIEKHRDALSILVARLKHDADIIGVSQTRAFYEEALRDRREIEVRLKSTSTRLKALLNDPDFPVTGIEQLLAADQPTRTPVELELTDQVEAAMQNRLELAQQSLRIDSADTVVAAAKNNELPKLDVSLQVGAQGLGRDFDDAVNSQGDLDFVTYAAGFQLEVPIGNRQARAIYQRTLLQRQQAVDQYRQLADQIGAEVSRVNDNVSATWDLMVAQRRTLYAYEDNLRALESRAREGEPLKREFVDLVLRSQSQVARARAAEIRATVNYNLALSRLERAKGTLLKYNNVTLKEEAGPMYLKAAAIPVAKKE